MFTIELIDEALRPFLVLVKDEEQIIHKCGWEGGHFVYNGKHYCVFGPYHQIDGYRFRVYEIVPVSEVK